jgi:hypothetical protein
LIKKEDGSGEEFFKERRWREIGRCGSVKRQGRTEEKGRGERGRRKNKGVSMTLLRTHSFP